MSFNSYYKTPTDSSRLTQTRQNKMIYANYITNVQRNDQGCNTLRTGLENGGVAPGSILPKLLDGARHTTGPERDAILANTSCSPITESPPIPPTPIPVITDGLILYYDVSNPASYPGTGVTIYDLSTSADTGALLNGVVYSSNNGGVLDFNGVNSFIATSGLPLTEVSFTVGCWFKCSNVIGDYRIFISKQEPDGSAYNYRLWLELNTGYLIGDIRAFDGSSSYIVQLSNLADNQWHMVFFSRESTTQQMKLYVDGNLVATQYDTITGSILNNQAPWIGFSPYLGGTYPFLGSMGSTFIYNRALTDAEILQNFNATKTRFGL